MLSASQIGNRLQTAREQRGISLKEAADAVDLTRTDIINLETGQCAVSVFEITKLAEIYQCPASGFLSADERLSEDGLLVVLHRKLSELESAQEIEFSSEAKVKLRRLFDLYSEGAALRRMLNQTVESTPPDYGTQTVNLPRSPVCQGEKVAEEERRRLGIGDEPIQNIEKLISGQGIWTEATELPDGLSGLFVNHPDVGLAILVNQQNPPVRRRFSYLHEFAHALFDRLDSAVIMTRQESLFDFTKKPANFMETRANAFAAAFLMPQEGVAEQLEKIGKGYPVARQQIGFDSADEMQTEANTCPRTKPKSITCQDVAVLAHHFGVSYEVAVWRLKNLGHISSSEEGELAEKSGDGRAHIKQLTHHELPPKTALSEACEWDIHNQLRRLSVEAFRQEEISRGRLVEIGRKLEIDSDEMLELAKTPCPD